MSDQKDSLLPVKYMGYCMSQMPPEDQNSTFEDFVRFAKFQLSLEKHVLMEDPIWDKYTDEQILVEYFAGLYARSKEERERLEVQLAGSDPDINEWFDKMIEKNQEEMAEKAKSYEDKVRFVPEALGD